MDTTRSARGGHGKEGGGQDPAGREGRGGGFDGKKEPHEKTLLLSRKD